MARPASKSFLAALAASRKQPSKSELQRAHLRGEAEKVPTRVVKNKSDLRPRPKSPKPIRSEAYLAFVREHPCVFASYGGCIGPIEAHHDGKHPMGEKTDDLRAVSACTGHHQMVTNGRIVTASKVHDALIMARAQVDLLVEYEPRRKS